MIDNAAWKAILQTANDVSTVCEIYDSDAVPGDDGFDPNDAVALYAAVDGISYMDCDYTRLVTQFGSIKRTIDKEANTASVTFSNVNRVISRFEFNTGFEGLVMVIRVISRSQSDSLNKSQILFAGRCDKPTSGTKEELTVNATWVLGGPEVQIPRRKFTPDDQEGRTPSDPEFEGFPFAPQYGTTTYSARVNRGGILGLFGFKKTVQKTLSYSSYNDLDANRPVPEVFGRSQLLLRHVGYVDIGTLLEMRSAVCEGEIFEIDNVRSLDSRLPLTNHVDMRGLVGAANDDGPLSTWVAPGYYSRTAMVRSACTNTTVDEVDPAPDIAAVILGRVMTIPDEDGEWTVDDTWSNDAAVHTRFVLTSNYYYKLDESWLEDSDFTETYNYDREMIIRQTASDFQFLVAG